VHSLFLQSRPYHTYIGFRQVSLNITEPVLQFISPVTWLPRYNYRKKPFLTEVWTWTRSWKEQGNNCNKINFLTFSNVCHTPILYKWFVIGIINLSAELTCIANKTFWISPSSFSRISSCTANARVASEFFWAKAAVFRHRLKEVNSWVINSS